MPMGLSQALTTLGVQQVPGDKGEMRGTESERTFSACQKLHLCLQLAS